jgi:hypothetical protein
MSLGLALVTVLAAASGAKPAGAQLGPDTGVQQTWGLPTLVRPITVAVSNVGSNWLHLIAGKDYIVRLPAVVALNAPGGLVIEGGRNVVLVGGQINIPLGLRDQRWTQRRGLLLKNQTGTIHVEGVRLTGDLVEGIDLEEMYGAVVQLRNINVGVLHARDEVNFTDNHPDILQTWAGPRILRVDGLTGISDYQGIFISPKDVGSQPPPKLISLNRINITGTHTARYLLWENGNTFLQISDVWVAPNPLKPYSFFPLDARWHAVQTRVRRQGDFVPAAEVGIRYRSVS